MENGAEVLVEDSSMSHVHPPGTTFVLDVRPPVRVRYVWKDWRGQTLTPARVLESGVRASVRSPVRPEVGYLGLAFEPIDPNVALARAEYGFAVLPSLPEGHRKAGPDVPFGTIHTDLGDPYLIGWTKTATLVHGWDFERGRLDVDAWRARIGRGWERGLIELPLFADKNWDTDSTRPVSPEKLDEIYAKAKQYFQATPELLHWELGIEENLRWRRNRDAWAYYWPNLAQKFQAVRRAADEVNPGIRLIYQVAELDYSSIEAFLRSEAARHVDILSLHPYAWPDFPSPEEWMPELITRTRRWMKQYGVEMPIWFTEIGAPHQGNPGGFFGYPEKNVSTKGKSRDEEVVYMIKSHVMALHLGVQRIFWYNYRDRGSQPNYAEHHFGMRDYWGFPKPVYVAYIHMIRTIQRNRPIAARRLPDGVWTYRFGDPENDLLIAWVYPAAEREVSFADLNLSKERLIRATNAVGTPLAIDGTTVHLTGSPVYFISRP